MTIVAVLVAESKALLVGEGADVATLREIRALTQAEEGVELGGYPMTMYFGPSSILLTMNIRFGASLSRDGIQEAIDRVEAAVRQRFPHIQDIYLEAESLRTNVRLSDPNYLLQIRRHRHAHASTREVISSLSDLKAINFPASMRE